MRNLVFILCASLLLGGCASVATLDKAAHVSDEVRSKAKMFVQMQARVSRIAYRLATRGVSLCSDVGPRNPLQFYSAKVAGRGLGSRALNAIYQLYGLDEHLRVLNVLASPSVIDGALARGDRITSINGQAVDDNDLAGAVRDLQDAVASGKRFEIAVLRADDTTHGAHIAPVPGCSGQVLVLATRAATTDVVDYGGDAVGLPADLVRYFKTDDELAFLIGRQLYYTSTNASIGRKTAAYTGAALNGVMRFFTFGIGNVVVNLSHAGVILARKVGAGSADLFALKLMRTAGYDAHDVAELWQRIDKMLADKRPDNATLAPSKSRRAAVEKAIKEADAPSGAQITAGVSVK